MNALKENKSNCFCQTLAIQFNKHITSFKNCCCETKATSSSKQPVFLNTQPFVWWLQQTHGLFLHSQFYCLVFCNWCFGNISLWDQINIMVCDVNLPRLAEQHPKSLKNDIYKSWQGSDAFLLPAQPLFFQHSRPSDRNQEQLQACESLAFACLQSSLLYALKVWCQSRDICLCLLAFSLVQNQLDSASCQNHMDFTSISMQTYDTPFSRKFNVDVTSGTVQEVVDSFACPDMLGWT